nr:putative receptor protein kinase ZmPK1 [Ipomoea batatas]
MYFKQQETVRALMIARPLLITTETEALLDFLLAHSWGNMFNRAVARISVWNSVCCASTSCAKANAAVSDDGLARITSLRISGFSPAINIEINTGAGTLVTLFNSFSYALRYAPTVRWMLPKVVLKDSGYHLRWQHGGFEWCLKLTWLSKVELADESWVEDIVDKRLEGNFSRRQARTLIKVGVACMEEDRNMRPTMASVVQTLLECEDETTVIQTSDPLYI